MGVGGVVEARSGGSVPEEEGAAGQDGGKGEE